MITPADLINQALQSRYHHVGKVGGQPSRGGSRVYYQAYAGAGRGGDWKGPARSTAHQAAQDYCDYVNSGQGTHAPAPRNKSAGHKRPKQRRQARDPEVEAALGVLRDARAQRAGVQGYVYLIIEDLPGGGLRYGKVGYSVNPKKRVAELQTGNPRKLKLHLMKPGTLEDEARLHVKYAKENVLQEWFHISKDLLLEWDASHQVN